MARASVLISGSAFVTGQLVAGCDGPIPTRISLRSTYTSSLLDITGSWSGSFACELHGVSRPINCLTVREYVYERTDLFRAGGVSLGAGSAVVDIEGGSNGTA